MTARSLKRTFRPSFVLFFLKLKHNKYKKLISPLKWNNLAAHRTQSGAFSFRVVTVSATSSLGAESQGKASDATEEGKTYKGVARDQRSDS